MTRFAPRAAPWLLRDLADPGTYGMALYALLAFPLGLLYFVFLVVGLSLGAALLIVWVGLPILLFVLAGTLAFADLERALSARLLGAPVPRFPRRRLSEGVWSWVREQLGDVGTWKAALYLTLKFPLGLASFVILVVLIAVTLALLLAPLALLFGPGVTFDVFGADAALPSPFAWVALSVAGFGFALLTASVARGLGWLWRALALALLADGGEARLAQREVQALSRSASIIAFAGSLEETLSTLIGQALDATGARALAVWQVGAPAQSASLCAARGLPSGFAQELARVHELLGEELPPGRAQIVRAARRAWQADGRFALLHAHLSAAAWDTVVSVPLVYRGVRVGRLDAFFPEDGPRERELDFLAAIADQAAVAIENARLFSRSQEQASLEERQRLARELHDSVAQALYGITLGVKTARTWLERDPARAAEPLDYVLSLAEGGTAEMKALLFALRPDALAQEGLVAALTKQTAVLSARYKLQVETDLGDEPGVPLQVKEALYRIAQEALHNSVKHARAGVVRVALREEEGHVTLRVQDDGQGFDPDQDFPGHLGLRSMRERAHGVGALLTLHTAPGAGVDLRVRVPLGSAA